MAKKEKEKEPAITEIYKDEDGKTPDLTKLDKVPKKKRWLWSIIIFIILAAAASVAGFFLFNRDWDKGEDIKLTISGVEKAKSGEMVTLEVKYENKGRVAIRSGELSVNYPEGFYFSSSSPQQTGDKNNVWEIGEVAAGAGGKIKITGQIVGEMGTDKEFTALLVYKPANFNYDFQASASHKIFINSSIVTLNVEAPQRVKSNEEITYRVKFKNPSNLSIVNLKVTIDYPTNFEAKEIKPSAELNNNSWRFSELKEKEEKEITILGIIHGESYETQEFKFRLGLIEPNGNFNLQVEKSTLLLIVNPELELTLTGPDRASLGEEIKYDITVKNTSDVNIDNLELKMEFSSAIAEVPAFEKINLAAKSELPLEKTVKLKKKSDEKNIELIAILKAEKGEVEKEETEFSQTAEVKTKIKGTINFQAEARYYAEDLTRLGSGPLPPKVNETTTYKIFWKLEAGNNDLKNIEVMTTLPEEVLWAGEALNAVYERKTRQVKWIIQELKAGASKEANFSISVTPTPEDLNKLLILNNEAVVTATDEFINEAITAQSEQLTSDLEKDKAGKGKGVVES